MIRADDSLSSLKSIAPSFGHFGGTAADFLSINIGFEITAVRLSVTSTEGTFLNLRGMKLISKGRTVPIWLDEASCTQSSYLPSDSQRDPWRLIKFQSIHTGRENNPSWTLRLNSPCLVDSIHLYNRVDGWGSRSRAMCVEVLDSSGEWKNVHSPNVQDILLKLRNVLIKVCPSIEDKFDLFTMDNYRLSIIESVTLALKSNLFNLTASEWNMLISLLETENVEEFHPSERYLLASYLLYQRKRVPKTSSGIRSFSRLLDTKIRLMELEDEFPAITAHINIPDQFISRHGVENVGGLRTNAVDNLSHIRDIVLTLQDLDEKVILGYGTLLGAVRERDFLIHDDDVDLIWLTKAATREESESESDRIAEHFTSNGYHVTRISNFMNIHIKSRHTGAVVDLFPSWTSPEGCHLHMEKMCIRPLDINILSPTRLIELRGQLFPCPNSVSGFLEERYGFAWTVENRFYEWQWPLSD